MIQLSKRLNAVAELLVHGIDQLELEQPVLADIGTDHAYLPVYLVQKKVVKKAYAADVRKGPQQELSRIPVFRHVFLVEFNCTNIIILF